MHTNAIEGIFMSTNIRWNIAVSPDTDQSVRMFLASQGGGRKGDLSKFIEEAVRTYIFERAVDQAKETNAKVSEADLTAMVTEAVQWAREQ
jgi:Ribbon-helix-helix domain